jgi:hypothetical protein
MAATLRRHAADPGKFELVANVKTTWSLNLEISPRLLNCPDEVIERLILAAGHESASRPSAHIH